VFHYVGMHVVCNGSIVWVGGVALGLHCVAPFVAGASGDKDSMPKGNAPVNYLEENTWQHVGASARARSIRPTLSPVLSGTNERASPAERPR
jgi:hypothetical protein